MLSYHDIMALHLRLFVGQFVILHLKTKIEDKEQISGVCHFNTQLKLDCFFFFIIIILAEVNN